MRNVKFGYTALLAGVVLFSLCCCNSKSKEEERAALKEEIKAEMKEEQEKQQKEQELQDAKEELEKTKAELEEAKSQAAASKTQTIVKTVKVQTPTPPAPKAAAYSFVTYRDGSSSDGYVAVRSAANSSSAEIGRLYSGDYTDFVGNAGRWYKVRYDGMIGYVYAKYAMPTN